MRSHFIEQVGQVGDFRLAGAVEHDGLAVGESRCHEHIFRASYGYFVENNLPAAQAFCAGFDVAVILNNGCTQTFQTFDVEVDGASADGAASRKRDASATTAGDQRAENQRRSTHSLDQFVGCLGRCQVAATNRGAMLGAPVTEFDFSSHGREQLARGFDVADLGNIFQDHRFFGEESSGHRG